MPAFLHNEFIRAKVLGAKFRFGRPNCFFNVKNRKAADKKEKTRQTGLSSLCLRVFFCEKLNAPHAFSTEKNSYTCGFRNPIDKLIRHI